MDRYGRTHVDGVNKKTHRLVWERAYGPIPDGCVIHHINNDPRDNRLENLMMLTAAEHKRLHAKMRADGTEPTPTEIVLDDRKQQQERYRAHREERLAKVKKYNSEHAEERKLKAKLRYAEKRDEIRSKVRLRYKDPEYRAKLAASRELHKEEISARRAIYRKTHSAEISDYMSKYRKAHKEQIAKQIREYRSAHKEQTAEARAKWTKEHADQILVYRRLRYSIKKGKPQEVIDKLRAAYEALKKAQAKGVLQK